MVLIAMVVVAGAAATTWFFTRDDGGGTGGTTVPGGEPIPLAVDVLGPGPGPQQGVTGQFTLGPEETIAVGRVEPEGGSIVASDGLVITVGAGTHQVPTDYTVTSQQILGHDFGPLVTPATPLYTVNNGGGYSDALIYIDVPIVVPDEHVAIGFFHDTATGKLEAMPAVSVDGDSLTLATRHFSTFFVHIVGIGYLPITAPDVVVDSGFRPGVDDWQFANNGSAATPEGHCAGQSLSAIWYYETQRRLGAPPLYGLYDNNGDPATPALWEDDSQGYRLCSAVQVNHAAVWSSLGSDFFETMKRSNLLQDGLWQFAQFLGALEVTGQPQLVLIWSAGGGGHAMIVYGAAYEGLWVADPNYPAKYRLIPWDFETLTLGPYFSGPNAKQLGTEYDEIAFAATTRMIDWPDLGGRWPEFLNGTAGDSVFPSYALKVIYEDADGNRQERSFLDHIIVSLEEVELSFEMGDSGDCRDKFGTPPTTVAGPAQACAAAVVIHDGTTELGGWVCLDPADASSCSGTLKVKLDEGDNEFGAYIAVERVRPGDTSSTPALEYVDFHDFTITRGSGLAVEMVPNESEVAGMDMLVKDPPQVVENPDVPGEIVAITASYKAGPVERAGTTRPGRPYVTGWDVLMPDPADVCMGSGWGGADAGFGPNMCIDVRLSLWDGDPAPFDPAAVRTEDLGPGTADPCRVEAAPPNAPAFEQITYFPCVESFTGSVDQGVEIFGWDQEDRNLGVARYQVRAVVGGVRIDVTTAYRNYHPADVRTDRMREVVTTLVNDIARSIRVVTGE
jgi:hypothetical protein